MVARQRMQMRMPRLAHFYNHVYSVGDTRVPDSKKGDVFWWVASSKKQATAVATVVLAASVDVALDCSSFAAIC
eukprot:6459706-Pyramimonas_sp.AAC.1